MTQTLTHQVPCLIETFKADGTIAIYRAVKLSTTDETVIACTDNQAAIGVSLEAATDGQNLRVGLIGIFPVECNAAVAKDAIVHPAAAAGLIDDDAAAGEFILGRALRAATAQNDVIPVFVCPMPYNAT